MFGIGKDDLLLLREKLNELKDFLVDDEYSENYACGDCEARNSSLYCGNRSN